MITFNHHIKFFRSVIFERTSFSPKYASYAENSFYRADGALLDEKNSYLAIPQENILLCNSLCPVCRHIQVAIKKVI